MIVMLSYIHTASHYLLFSAFLEELSLAESFDVPEDELSFALSLEEESLLEESDFALSSFFGLSELDECPDFLA